MKNLDHLENDCERALYFQNMLISWSTGGSWDNIEYQEFRSYFLDNLKTKKFLPDFIRINRELSQVWHFIKTRFATYAQRREFIYDEFSSLLDYLESSKGYPLKDNIDQVLKSFDQETVHRDWSKTLERKDSDPEGAITSARSLLESVCKHILDSFHEEYDHKTELPDLYKKTAKKLNLHTSQHEAEIIKQILGGCSAVVNGIGALRNKLGDAHGKGRVKTKPASRHAELVVNLAGSMAVFLVQTFNHHSL